jgi:hypothetical protein
MPVQASPTPLGDADHYTFVFPIRPGETQFQITYRLPYDGSLQLSPKPSMTFDTVAIMMPKSMTFQAGPGANYTPVTEETSAQTYVARNVSPSQQIGFTVSGTGQLPRDNAAATAGSNGQPAGQSAEGSAAGDTRPGGGLGNPIDPSGKDDPWSKYKWWIIGALGLAMAAGAGIMLKNNPQGAIPVPAAGSSPLPAVPTTPSNLLATLKEELFAIETDRLEGRLSEEEYAEQKAALEVVLRRALARSTASSASASKATEANPLRG